MSAGDGPYAHMGKVVIADQIIIITAVIVAFLWDPETLTRYRFGKEEKE